MQSIIIDYSDLFKCFFNCNSDDHLLGGSRVKVNQMNCNKNLKENQEEDNIMMMHSTW